jgi:tRNA1(Val) A37 N6-methylase TrmN6
MFATELDSASLNYAISNVERNHASDRIAVMQGSIDSFFDVSLVDYLLKKIIESAD